VELRWSRSRRGWRAWWRGTPNSAARWPIEVRPRHGGK